MTTVSEQSPRRPRRRRAEVERSITAIINAAVHLLGQRPDASMDDVAAAAGVARQTIYAHFASRDALLAAVLERTTNEFTTAVDAARLEEGPAAMALSRFLDAGWRLFERFPLLAVMPDTPITPDADRALHEPVVERLERLIQRGQEAGEFDRGLSPAWLLTTTLALGHAAVRPVRDETMAEPEAAAALKLSVLRVFGVADAEAVCAHGTDRSP